MTLRELHSFVCKLPGATDPSLVADISRVEFNNGLIAVTSLSLFRGEESAVSVEIRARLSGEAYTGHSVVPARTFPLNKPMDILLFILFGVQGLPRDTGITLENEFFSRETSEETP